MSAVYHCQCQLCTTVIVSSESKSVSAEAHREVPPSGAASLWAAAACCTAAVAVTLGAAGAAQIAGDSRAVVADAWVAPARRGEDFLVMGEVRSHSQHSYLRAT